MRDYQQVNVERYEKDSFSGKGILNNIYSPINRVGNYSFYKTTQEMRRFIRMLTDCTKSELDEITILDCGCGTGIATRIISNLLGNTENVYGFEYSKNRLEYCKKMNPAIHYTWGDIVRGGDIGNTNFKGIIVSDVLSQIRKEKDVLTALENIYNWLEDDGLFLWHDILAKKHYMNFDADTQGFSRKEMDIYAEKAGFQLVDSFGMYRIISLFDKNYFDTYYHISDREMSLVCMEILERVLFFCRYFNVCRIYKKQTLYRMEKEK